jgi:hypothetical protein
MVLPRRQFTISFIFHTNGTPQRKTMILYTLKNLSYTLDVYENKITVTPRLWKTLFLRSHALTKTIAYSELQKVSLQEKLWPQSHCLTFYSENQIVHFQFTKLLPFYRQLKLYLERQILHYHHSSHHLHLKQRSLNAQVKAGELGQRPYHSNNKALAA